MVRRLPAGPSRRHPRSNACCGVVNAMLGSEFCATSPLSLVATRSTMRKPDGELLASNGETNRHDIVTVRLSARDPHARVIVATQAEHNIREARVKKKAVTRTTGMLIQQTTHVLQASPRRYRTFRIVMAARYPRFARMRATVCHRRVMLRCMRPLWREAADFH